MEASPPEPARKLAPRAPPSQSRPRRGSDRTNVQNGPVPVDLLDAEIEDAHQKLTKLDQLRKAAGDPLTELHRLRLARKHEERSRRRRRPALMGIAPRPAELVAESAEHQVLAVRHASEDRDQRVAAAADAAPFHPAATPFSGDRHEPRLGRKRMVDR